MSSTTTYKALVIPVEGPVLETEIPADNGLKTLQGLVGGYIEAVNVPEAFGDKVTAYINEEGKYLCEPNRRATDFFVPGWGLQMGDYVAGPLVLVGFDPMTGEHLPELPSAVVDRVRLIEDVHRMEEEAGVIS